MVNNVEAAQTYCLRFGAYLAELNDDAEFRFALEFIKRENLVGSDDVYVCAGEKGNDGKWWRKG